MKDQFHVKGLGTTMGYVGWIDSFEGDKSSKLKCRAESELVRELQSLGATVIAKSTLVQSLWFGETRNNILGYHWNPMNQKLSSGGSSGGEAAVQAMRGSAVGFGTDIGGSVSMPAAFNGVYSLKPSVGRLPTLDMPDSSPGQINMQTAVGILGPSIATIMLVMKAIVSTEPWLSDPSVFPLPWRHCFEDESTEKSNLSFGYMEFDSVVMPHPPILRALRMAKLALQEDGHELIPWEPPSHEDALAIHAAITSGDGNYDVFKNLELSGEPLIPELIPDFPDQKPLPPKSAIEVEQTVLKMLRYRVAYQNYWLSTASETSTGRPVDAVLLPVAPSAAVIPGKMFHYSYTTFVNVVDYPSVVIPVTRADKFIDTFDCDYRPVGETDKKNWEAYDPEIYHGAPASIQVIGKRLREEKLLSISQAIVDALQRSGQQTGQ